MPQNNFFNLKLSKITFNKEFVISNVCLMRFRKCCKSIIKIKKILKINFKK